MSNFEIGERVEVAQGWATGKTGKVAQLYPVSNTLRVDLDEGGDLVLGTGYFRPILDEATIKKLVALNERWEEALNLDVWYMVEKMRMHLTVENMTEIIHDFEIDHGLSQTK